MKTKLTGTVGSGSNTFPTQYQQEAPTMARLLTTPAQTPRLRRLIVIAVVATVAFLAGSLAGAGGGDLRHRAPASGQAVAPAVAAPRIRLAPPIQMAASSAYDGQAVASRAAVVNHPPISSAGSSAYDGRPVQAAKRPVAFNRASPIQTAASSAYDGQAGKVSRPGAGWSSGSPIQTAASSAYDGQPASPHRAPMSGTPIRSAGSSAYDGQPTR